VDDPFMPADLSQPGARLPDLGPRGEGWVAIQVVLFVLLALAGSAGPAWGDPWLAIGRVVGVLLAGLGIVVAGLGFVGLRENLTAVPRPVEGGRLVDTGVYGLVRHPLGLGVFFDLKSRREEAWLVAAYPGYAGYRRRVRKLVPLVY
jgi:protein-S-isoprenylcysteine O-methyltransferase Ste14